MDPSRDNPMARFAAFWWGIGVIFLFGFVLWIVSLFKGGDSGVDPLEQAAALKRYQARAQVDEAQQAALTEVKVVEEGRSVQVPPTAVFGAVGRQLVASSPVKVDKPEQVVPGSAAAEALAATAAEAPPSDNASVDALTPAAGTAPDPAVMELGKQSYMVCLACHGANGEGGVIAPPLAGSDWVAGPVSNLIRIQLRGLTGPITVSGKDYEFPAPMAPLAYQSDEQVAAVLTYVRNSFGNSAPPVLPEQVTMLRGEVGKPMLTQQDLIPIGDAAAAPQD